MSQFDWSISLAPTNNLRGSPEAVEYFKTLKNELADRVANNIGAVKNERFRLYWDHIHIWYKLRYLSEWFAEHDACVVASNYTQDGFFYHPEDIDPAKPLETFALEQSRVGMIRNLDYHINLVSQYVEDYKLDGLVMHACRTCRSMELGQFDVVDAISKKYGIPGIVIEGDHCDPTLFSESLWNDRLEAFLETVAVAKSTR
jgi:benzoyl-CoA reductase subunit B